MSRRGVIEAEPPQTCELCGNVEETRPYGPNGEEVCFDCGMKDEEAVKRGFRAYVLGEVSDGTREGEGDPGSHPASPDE
jgi:hypothetical protein